MGVKNVAAADECRTLDVADFLKNEIVTQGAFNDGAMAIRDEYANLHVMMDESSVKSSDFEGGEPWTIRDRLFAVLSDWMQIKAAYSVNSKIRDILVTGVQDVLMRRITRTGEIPEALDVELGYVNGGPENLRVCNLGGDYYIHADDIANQLGIKP